MCYLTRASTPAVLTRLKLSESSVDTVRCKTSIGYWIMTIEHSDHESLANGHSGQPNEALLDGLNTEDGCPTMFCSRCGQKIRENAAFCSGCGRAVAGGIETTRSEAWSGGAMTGLVIATLLIPLIGLIIGPMNFGEEKRNGQAVMLFIEGILMAIANTIMMMAIANMR